MFGSTLISSMLAKLLCLFALFCLSGVAYAFSQQTELKTWGMLGIMIRITALPVTAIIGFVIVVVVVFYVVPSLLCRDPEDRVVWTKVPRTFVRRSEEKSVVSQHETPVALESTGPVLTDTFDSLEEGIHSLSRIYDSDWNQQFGDMSHVSEMV
jgi:hypothetical protein